MFIKLVCVYLYGIYGSYVFFSHFLSLWLLGVSNLAIVHDEKCTGNILFLPSRKLVSDASNGDKIRINSRMRLPARI